MQKRSHTGWTYVVLGLTFFVSTLLAPFLWKEPEKEEYRFPQRPAPHIASATPKKAEAQAPAVLEQPSEAMLVKADRPAQLTEETSAPERALPPPGLPSATAMAQERIALDPSVANSLNPSESDVPSSEVPPPAVPPAASLSDTESEPPAAPKLPAADPPFPEPAPAPLVEAEAAPLRGGAWPVAKALHEQLADLGVRVPLANSWTERVRSELDLLSEVPSLADAAAIEHLDRIERLLQDAKQQASRPERFDGRSLVLRACYALQRRMEIWQTVARMEAQGGTIRNLTIEPGEVAKHLAAIAGMLKGNPEEAGWRRYLLLAEAGQILPGFDEQPTVCQRLAREILRRIHSPQLEIRQELLLKQPPVAAYEKLLRQIATERTDRAALLAAIEAYEASPLTREAAAVANCLERLRWSTSQEDVELANRLGVHYRNANVRVALTEELVNRLLPKDQWSRDPVYDNILGAEVQGQSTTHAQIKLTLVPDRERWRLGVEAIGQVASSTASSKGPATFYQDGQSRFHARKMLLIDRSGVRLYRAEAAASASSALRDYETGYDSIPLFGAIARAVAKNAYEEQSAWAQGEIEDRIANQASARLDQEVRKQVEQAQKEVYSTLIDPLNDLRLDPTPVEFETTAERLIARYRVAGNEQLAAHTPRPQAPAGSLLSVQLHQTTLNNLFDHLEFDGMRAEIRELLEGLAKKFQMQDMKIPEDMPEGVQIEFAEHDAVRLDCVDGRVRVTIRLAELSQGKRVWRDFAVRAYYKPDAVQLHANLVRDGAIELPEGKLTVGDQIALRGVFSKVLSKNRPFNLINNKIASAPSLRDLKVTQFVVDDGWMAIAIGYPEHLNAKRLQNVRPR